jgi:hypothetical protein
LFADRGSYRKKRLCHMYWGSSIDQYLQNLFLLLLEKSRMIIRPVLQCLFRLCL